MHLMLPTILRMAIPGMYGPGPGLLLGWTIHLFHSVVFGLLYVAIVRRGRLAEYAIATPTGTALGVGYGVIVRVIVASIVMPAWVGAMLPLTPPVPDFNRESLAGHVVYGAILGALYRCWLPDPDTSRPCDAGQPATTPPSANAVERDGVRGADPAGVQPLVVDDDLSGGRREVGRTRDRGRLFGVRFARVILIAALVVHWSGYS